MRAPSLKLSQANLELRPTWRGRLHAAVAPLALAGGIILFSVAISDRSRSATLIFAATSFTLFTVSALYHRGGWSQRVSGLLQRVDHANIFLLIAGTYTPLALLALPAAQGEPLLAGVWLIALAGATFRVCWLRAPRWLYVGCYAALGWSAALYAPQLLATNAPAAILIFGGGVIYTLGAFAYGARWPNPLPTHFGFHEVFHACTVIAFACHWVATLLLALQPAS